MTLAACSTAPVVSPPRVVEVVKAAPIPAVCRQLRTLALPPGATAEDVMREQHRLIVEYEAQVAACAGP